MQLRVKATCLASIKALSLERKGKEGRESVNYITHNLKNVCTQGGEREREWTDRIKDNQRPGIRNLSSFCDNMNSVYSVF